MAARVKVKMRRRVVERESRWEAPSAKTLGKGAEMQAKLNATAFLIQDSHKRKRLLRRASRLVSLSAAEIYPSSSSSPNKALLHNYSSESLGASENSPARHGIATLSALPSAFSAAFFLAPALVSLFAVLSVSESGSSFHEGNLPLVLAVYPAMDACVAVDEARGRCRGVDNWGDANRAQRRRGWRGHREDGQEGDGRDGGINARGLLRR